MSKQNPKQEVQVVPPPQNEEPVKINHFILEATSRNAIIYGEDDEKGSRPLVQFRNGTAQVTEKQRAKCREHSLWGKTFGDIGTIKNAAHSRPVEVVVR